MEIFNNPNEYKGWYIKHLKIYNSEKKVVELLNLKDCIDIGSGPAIFHEVMKGRTISIDISEFMLKDIDNDKIVADALYLPIRDHCVKCAFISVTICFIDNIEAFIREIWRVATEINICIVAKDSPWGEFYEKLGKNGHKYYSKAHFISKQDLIKYVSKYYKIVKVISTLTYSPFDQEKDEYPRLDSSGSYVCVKGIKTNNS
jgi:ubiquinone/menaquinone biosynthesis C-methylase UbiE